MSLHRFVEVEEIADIYIFLIKNEYMIGGILSVDGGYSYE